jgi:hypothetical protein
MRVFRIEHSVRSHGPYIVPLDAYECDAFCEDECEMDREYIRISNLAWAIVGAHQDRNHRSPSGIHRHEICGFDSVYALEAWFSGWLPKLFGHGYVVAEYECENVRHHGNGQVTFNRYVGKRLTTTTV